MTCPSCGAPLSAPLDALVRDCSSCGAMLPTPSVETIENLCRNVNCLHALDPDHDEFGCHVPGCSCTVAQRVIETPEDGLPRENAAGHELAKKLGVKRPDQLPFDQPNLLGCNGCDEIRVPLNVDGYCKRCASQQGEFLNAGFDAHAKGCENCNSALEQTKPELMCDAGAGMLRPAERTNSASQLTHFTVSDPVTLDEAARAGAALFGGGQ